MFSYVQCAIDCATMDFRLLGSNRALPCPILSLKRTVTDLIRPGNLADKDQNEQTQVVLPGQISNRIFIQRYIYNTN